jgi:hypothetical protein
MISGMCGRYTIRSLRPIVDMFGLTLPEDFPTGVH